MKVKVFIASKALLRDGKLDVINLAFAGMKHASPFALIIMLEVTQDEVGKKFDLRADLVDSDGHPVLSPPVGGGQPGPTFVHIGDGTVSSATNHPPGSTLHAFFPVNVGVLPLKAGQAYEWRVTVDGRTRPDWFASFYVAGAADGDAVAPVPDGI